MSNHASAFSLLQGLATYINKEVKEGAMLGPFDKQPTIHPLVPSKHTAHQTQKGQRHPVSNYGSVLTTLSQHRHQWLNPKRDLLGIHSDMNLQSAQDWEQAITQAGKSSFLYCSDIARAYRQFPLNLADSVSQSVPQSTRKILHECQPVLRSLLGSNLLPRCLQPHCQGTHQSGTQSTVTSTIFEASPALRLRQLVILIACTHSSGAWACKRLHTMLTHHRR